MEATAPKIIRITDEITTCDCCGRQNLKRTVELELADGDHVWYGTTCASKAFPRLGNGAAIAKSATFRCACGCGEFGTLGLNNGTFWSRPCYDRMMRERAAK